MINPPCVEVSEGSRYEQGESEEDHDEPMPDTPTMSVRPPPNTQDLEASNQPSPTLQDPALPAFAKPMQDRPGGGTV